MTPEMQDWLSDAHGEVLEEFLNSLSYSELKDYLIYVDGDKDPAPINEYYSARWYEQVNIMYHDRESPLYDNQQRYRE